MIKFVTDDYRPKIETVEIEKETAVSVWIKGRRNAKRSYWRNYHDTWKDAKQFIMDAAEEKVSQLRLQLELEKGKQANIKGLKPPS